MFKLSRTFRNDTSPQNENRGFPAPGEGAQSMGDFTPPPYEAAWASGYPIQGAQTWGEPGGADGGQQGFPSPLAAPQRRTGWGRGPVASGLPVDVLAPWFSGHVADRTVHNYGKVLTNPIGAGVVALHRPQASYGPAAQYENGAIWWTSQAVPTSIHFQGLTDPAALAAVISPINLQAMIRTTG